MVEIALEIQEDSVLPHHGQHFALIAWAIWNKKKDRRKYILPGEEKIIYLQKQVTLKLFVHNYMAKSFCAISL